MMKPGEVFGYFGCLRARHRLERILPLLPEARRQEAGQMLSATADELRTCWQAAEQEAQQQLAQAASRRRGEALAQVSPRLRCWLLLKEY